MSYEPLPEIHVPDIDLHGQFYTMTSPVQAWGTYRDKTWDFRAKSEHWDFVLSPFHDYPAEDISNLCWYDLDLVQKSDKPFPADMVRAFRGSFIRSGEYGAPGSFAAGKMSTDEAGRIIRECIALYESSRA
jgi:hypothetical protein